ncbi:MAG: acyl carrier protein [Chitinivibrionales bacterium]|nr:acyl carrier protein [Chitinivibrionales bacterium]
MDISEIKKELRDLIIEIAEDMDVEEDKVSDNAHFIEDMGLDSMALLEVLATMEKKFGVSIPESEFPNITSIDKCATTVQKYLSEKQS